MRGRGGLLARPRPGRPPGHGDRPGRSAAAAADAPSTLVVLGLLALSLAAGGCGDGSSGGTTAVEGTVLRFEVEALDVLAATDPYDPAPAASFYDFPWPSPVRLRADGHVDLTGFDIPRELPSQVELLLALIGRIEDVTAGYGTQAGAFFRADGALDPSSFPADAAASLEAGASAFLLDVDRDSPARGERLPVRVGYRAAPTGYVPSHLVTVAPVAGFPMRPDTSYAFVVTRAVRDAAGEPLGSPLALERVKVGEDGGDARLALLASRYEEAWEALAEHEGLDRADVAALTLVDARDAVSDMFRIRDWIHDTLPVEAPTELAFERTTDDFHELRGRVDLPAFQDGRVPYLLTGGEIELDGAGDPVLRGTESVRFALTVPVGPMPPGGWPVVLYAHGTGGSYRSFIGSGHARRFAERGLAGISIDQPLHGDRVANPDVVSSLFYNFANPSAARDNGRQAAAETVQLLRFVRALVLSAGLVPDGVEARFDPGRTLFMGHSQGATWGPLFLTAERDVPCGMFSGAGGNLITTILLKEDPFSILGLVDLLAGTVGTDELDAFHPILHLVQLAAEEVDGPNYVPYLARREGRGARSAFFTEGLLDGYVAPDMTDTLVAAGGVPPLDPVARPTEVHALAGLASQTPPVAGNVHAADGTVVTLGMAQFPDDGHFATSRNEVAEDQYATFLETCAAGTPTIPAGL